ncbi:hypothetical protein K1719_037288 [Acacia pycnantha]|nr:hypothetical protein K1719_037288 [Acacia pycnantha]
MEEIQISNPLVWREAETERILIGKVLSNKTYTRAALESILRKAWNLPEGFDIIEITGNAFLFKFADVEEFNRILRGRPWSINGFLLNLMERSKFKACKEFDFSKCPVWIQMHNVPMEAWCLENAVTIGGYVEEPRFGAWLTTNSCRSWDEVLVVICNDWSESDHTRRRKEEAVRRRSGEAKRKSEQVLRPDDDELFVINLSKPLVTKNGLAHSEGKDRKESEGIMLLSQDKGGVKANTRATVTSHSGLKEMNRLNTGSKDKGSAAADKSKSEGLVDRPNKAKDSKEGAQMKMVVYERRVLGDIINKIEDLGLKRNVAEEWETSKAKRLKVEKNSK